MVGHHGGITAVQKNKQIRLQNSTWMFWRNTGKILPVYIHHSFGLFYSLRVWTAFYYRFKN